MIRRIALLCLAVGGTAMLLSSVNEGGRTSSASPAAQPRWTIAGELSQPRAYARAVALETGEILVFGGLDPADPDVTLSTSELFDPDTGRVTMLKEHLLGRLNQSATTTWGGRVVVAGGTEWAGDQWIPTADVDLYLPWSRTWIQGAGLHQPRSDHGAAAMADGRVLVTGGNYGSRVLSSTEIYDPAADRWTGAAPLPRGRTQFSISALPDGTVLVAGGFQEDGRMTTSTLLYLPWRDEWIDGPEMREVRLNHSMVRLPSGDLLFFGGERHGGGTTERYSWREHRFSYAGVLGEPRLVAQGAALPDGRVVAVGGLPVARGKRAFDPTTDAELWDPAHRTWDDISDAPSKRAYAQIVVVGDDVYRLSGIGEDERPYATIEELTWN